MFPMLTALRIRRSSRRRKNHRTCVPLYRLGSFCMRSKLSRKIQTRKACGFRSGFREHNSCHSHGFCPVLLCIPLIISALKSNCINFAIFSSDVRVTRNGTEQETYGWSFPRSANCSLRKCSQAPHCDTLWPSFMTIASIFILQNWLSAQDS